MSGALCHTGFAAPRVLAQKRLFRRGALGVSKKATRRRSLMTWKCPLQQKGRLSRTTRPERKCSTRVQSVLGSISHMSATQDLFDVAVNSLVGGSAMICFALAFVPLLTYEQEREGQMEPDDLDTVKWSVAGVVSCFPYLNWTVERIAQTEPAILGTVMDDEQETTSVLGDMSRSFAHQLSLITSKLRPSNKQEGEKDSITEMVKRELNLQEGNLHDAEELARIEQNLWDEKFDTDKRDNQS